MLCYLIPIPTFRVSLFSRPVHLHSMLKVFQFFSMNLFLPSKLIRSTVCILTSCFTDSRPHLTPFLRQLERATTGVCASRSMCRWTPPVPGPATHTHALGRHHAPTWLVRQRKPTSRHGCACMCTARALPCAHLPMPAAGESAHQAG